MVEWGDDMIVPERDGTLTIACDVCGIGCPAPWYGHYDPSEAYAGARSQEWQADPYDVDLCPICRSHKELLCAGVTYSLTVGS